MFVADQGNNRIDVFTAEGAFVLAFGKKVAADGADICTTECVKGTESSEGGGLNGPDGLDVRGSIVYVADINNNRIGVYDTDGTFRYTFGRKVNANGADACAAGETCQAGQGGSGAGELGRPYDVKVTPSGLLAVTENENLRFALFTPTGEFVRAMGRGVNVATSSDLCTAASGCQKGAEGGFAGSLSSPTALAVDGAGNVYIADTNYNRIDEWSADGAFVKAFGAGVVDGGESFQVCTAETGCRAGAALSFPGAVPGPFGVTVDCQGAIWTAEAAGIDRVQRFGEAGTPLPTTCPVVEPVQPVTPTGPNTPGTTPDQNKKPPKSPEPSNKITFGKLKLNKKKGTATLQVKVPGPGKLVLAGKGLKKVTKSAKKAGTLSFGVKLVGQAKARLAKTGKARVKAKATFTPTGGKAASKTKSLTLKMTLG